MQVPYITRQFFCFFSVDIGKNQALNSIRGRLVWRGIAKNNDEKITCCAKRQWDILSLPDYSRFTGETSHVQEIIPTNKERTC